MILSEVSHPIHRIHGFEQSGSYLSFISSTTVDSAAGKCEQWYMAVPWVRCATLVNAEPYATVLAQGDHLAFTLMLRNDGNCFLSGVELAVAEVGQDPIGVITLAFSKDNTLESEWNPRGEDGELLNVEDDWALAPGMSARYYAEYVTIPDSWEGDIEIEVYITAVHASGSDALSSQAEDLPVTNAELESIEYIPQRRVRYKLTMDDEATEVAYAGTYSKADVTVMGFPKKPEDNGRNGGSGSGGTKPTSGKSGLPSTGDVLSVAALALAGAAGAAAHRALRSREGSEDDEA